MLAQALRDAVSITKVKSQSKQVRWQEDALRWFFSEEDSPGSLRWVSEVVDIDVDNVRDWVELHAKGSAEMRKKWQGKLSRWRRR